MIKSLVRVLWLSLGWIELLLFTLLLYALTLSQVPGAGHGFGTRSGCGAAPGSML